MIIRACSGLRNTKELYFNRRKDVLKAEDEEEEANGSGIF